MGTKTKKRVWADLKVGDEAIVVRDEHLHGLHGRKVRVEKIGRDWITVTGGDKYSVATGNAREFGGHLHSAATLAELTKRLTLLSRLSGLSYNAAGRRVPLEALSAFVKALDEA